MGVGLVVGVAAGSDSPVEPPAVTVAHSDADAVPVLDFTRVVLDTCPPFGTSAFELCLTEEIQPEWEHVSFTGRFGEPITQAEALRTMRETLATVTQAPR